MDNVLKIAKKNNALTDGYIPKTGKEVLSDKLLNALVYKYEHEGTTFKMSLADVRRLLGLKSDSRKDNERIYKAFRTLGTGIEMRNFDYGGKGIKWATGVFCLATVYKERQNYVEIVIDERTVSFLKQKYGYTAIDIDICNRFRSKFGLAVFEKIYLRYESLPNNDEDDVGYVSKDLDTLNKIFDTNYNTPSEMLRSINRGLREINKITGEIITCYYDKTEKVFVFSWKQKKRYLKSLSTFKKYIRKKYMPYHDDRLNKDFYPTILETEKGQYKVNKDGYLYIVTNNKSDYLDKVKAIEIWEKLYELAKNGKNF